MNAARLHSAKTIRLDTVEPPASPAAGEVIIQVEAVGICGSDLHVYADGHIGSTQLANPLVLGHEFMGTISAVGPEATDGHHQPLTVGTRVAVDPASPCYSCEMCEKGHPNLCPNHTFYGLYPHDGALQQQMIVNARNCFPIPDAISDAGGTLLETLGVAIHTLDLSHVRIGDDAAVIGCGPVGLLIIQLCRLAGVNNLYAFDLHDWRVERALALGATHGWTPEAGDPQRLIAEHTAGRGVDIAIEAAWADHSVQMAADMLRPGGRLVLAGIPGDDTLTMQHSTARRKGLTIMMVRRMKHTYPRAIALATSGAVQLDSLVTHHFPLAETAHAFDLNFRYQDNIVKAIVHPQQ
jgi:L-iditol 2-dehydrogenase